MTQGRNVRYSKLSYKDVVHVKPSFRENDSSVDPLGAFVLLKLSGLLLASPFEVATLLQQVEHNPRSDDKCPDVSCSPSPFNFGRGYVPLSPLNNKSVFGSINTIVRNEEEGWLGLWKGFTPRVFFETLHYIFLPSVESAISTLRGLHFPWSSIEDDDLFIPSVSVSIVSQALTGFILSPLDIIRTRLIVQTSNKAQRTYTSSIECCRSMLMDEGLYTIITGPILLPTLLAFTITPGFKCLSYWLAQRWFGVAWGARPMLYAICELMIDSFSLLISLPLQTIRRRLHCQIMDYNGTRVLNAPCVRLCSVPYRNMWDCFQRVRLEEGVAPPKKHRLKAEEKKKKSRWVIGGLYRGWRTHLTKVFLNFIINFLNELDLDE